MVRERGLEPPRPCEHMHLKHAWLPITALAHVSMQMITKTSYHFTDKTQGFCFMYGAYVGIDAQASTLAVELA